MAYSVGLYLGVDFVDLVTLGGSKETPKIIKSSRTAIFEEASPTGQKDRMTSIAPAIKKAFETGGVKIKSVNFAMPQDEVIVRRFSMPYLPVEERPNAVRFEAQKYLPFKLDDTISDFYVSAESKTARGMDVIFVAVNKQVIEKYTGLFKELKIGITNIDIIPIALLRLLLACKRINTEQTTVVVYVEKNSRGSVIIIKERNVYLVRELSLLASKEAFLENILNNIRLSIDYFKRETKEVGVSKIIICGDLGLQELELYLKENITSAQIETFNLKDEIDGLGELSRKQIIAIGLAMASLEKAAPKINLISRLPAGALPTGVMEYRPLVIEGVALFLILAMLQLIMNINLAQAKKKMAQVKAERMTILKGADFSQTELSAMESTTKSQIEFLKNLVGEKRLFLTEKLSSIGRLLPEGTWIESLQFRDEIDNARKLNVSGMIYSRDKNETAVANKILNDMKGLRDFSSGFEDIKLTSLERTALYSSEVLAFSIECSGQPLRSSEMFTESAGAPE